SHLEKISAPALRIQLLREFASFARVSAEDVERLLNPKAVQGGFRRPAPPKHNAVITAGPEVKLLRFVLVEPSLSSELELDLLDQGVPETGFLRLIADGKVDAEASSAVLIEYFQGTDFESVVADAQLKAEEFQISKDLALQDF